MKEDYTLVNTVPNILIVDDVPANLKVLGDILKGEGYKVRPVPNGTMALQVIEKERADLILLDIMMPEMDGFEVCRRLKENQKFCDIPIIFISALNDTKDIVNALNSGGVDYITKPFHSEEVIARVKTHLTIHRQSKELREQSKELRELIATKDKFFSIIAHDLRGPLGGFMSLTELMAEESEIFTPDQQKEMNIDLYHSARNIFNLLENLLEWSKMQQGQTLFQPQSVDLKKQMDVCLTPLKSAIQEKAIQIIVDISDYQYVFADTNMLQSVIRNLVSNAVKFTPRGGIVNVSAGLNENNTSVIVVKDTGIGMNNTLRANLFKLSSNVSRPGTEGEQSTGLGLLLCKEFVEKHNGEIWVESEEGKGSSFYFTLPGQTFSKDLPSENKNTLTDEAVAQIGNLKILIAEDNENSEILLRILAKSFSNRILGAGTGTEAVDVCRRTPDIDLILMDIKMPELDGYEATHQIRQFNKEVVIIAQTAFGLAGEREKALNAGCNDYIAKPIEMSLLIEIIHKHFKK